MVIELEEEKNKLTNINILIFYTFSFASTMIFAEIKTLYNKLNL